MMTDWTPQGEDLAGSARGGGENPGINRGNLKVAGGAREGSEEYFSEKIHETPHDRSVQAEETLLPPPQDMGEDG